jgi:hypothetical protein
LSWRLPSQRARETQIKTRVVNEDDRGGFALLNFAKGFVKLFPEITIFPQHFPQTEDCCLIYPVFELVAGDLSHLRAATPDKLELVIQLAQATH